MRIGELAKRTGVSPKTLRYWEEIGLLPRPPRNSSGYRDYPEEYVDLCRFILRAKAFGFKLSEIKEIIDIKLSGGRPCVCVTEKIKRKIEEIERRVEELRRRRRLLESLLKGGGEGEAFVCPIIESDVELEDEPPRPLVPNSEEIPKTCETEQYNERPL